MRRIHWLFFATLLGCTHRRSDPFGELQTFTPVPLLADSVVLARLNRQHPCEIHVPRLSRMSDNLAKPRLCTLVETAVATIRDLKAAPEVLPDLREFRIERVLCATVRQEAYRNDLTEEIELARWTVEFHSDEQPGVAVVISRLTGDAETFKGGFSEFGSAEDLCE